ncbi:MAG: hypothetical protein ACOX9E_15940, partial [Lentisphaeria bacterium]
MNQRRQCGSKTPTDTKQPPKKNRRIDTFWGLGGEFGRQVKLSAMEQNCYSEMALVSITTCSPLD